MPINEPRITVTCDQCEEETDPLELCALAGGGWDDRYIKAKLLKWGWKIDGDKTICEVCSTPEDA